LKTIPAAQKQPLARSWTPALVATALVLGLEAAFQPGPFPIVLIAALLDARFSASRESRGAFFFPALAAGLATALGIASGRLMEGFLLGGAVLRGAVFAEARRRQWTAGAAASVSLGALLGALFLGSLAAGAAGWVPAGGPNLAERWLRAARDNYVDQWRSVLLAALYDDGPFRVTFAGTPPPFPSGSRAAQMLEDMTDLYPKFLGALLGVGSVLLVLGMDQPRPRRWSDALANFRADERQMPLLIGALVFSIAAPRLAPLAPPRLCADAVLWAAGSLLWLQALALHAWMARLGRLRKEKGLYFAGAIGAIIVVLLPPNIGFLIGLADVYGDFGRRDQRRKKLSR
jgi:hypothetical protein